jgi:hypothetical protein
MRSRLVWSTVVLFVAVLVALPARAEGKHDKGQKLIEQGHRAYNLGHFADALAVFEKAYEDSGDSALLFDLAESHRQLGQNADALRLYNAYLREQPNGRDHEAAAMEIKNLTSGTTAKPPGATTPPPVTAAPVVPPPPPPVAPPPPKPAAPPPPPPPPPPPSNPWPPPAATAPPPSAAPGTVAPIGPASTGGPALPGAAPPPTDSPFGLTQSPPPPRQRSKVPVIVGAAATGAFVAGAVAFTLASNSYYNDLKSSCGATSTGCQQDQIDTVKLRDHLATGFWIAAAAAAVATSVLLVVHFN